MVRARLDEAIRRLELVRREELDAVADSPPTPAPGRNGGARLAALEARLAVLETGAAGSEPHATAVEPPLGRGITPGPTEANAGRGGRYGIGMNLRWR